MKEQSSTPQPRSAHGQAVLSIFSGWLNYAEAQRSEYGRGIGEDSVLGPAWARIGDGLRDLLGGPPGGADAAMLDGLICAELQQEGFDPDDL